ncbi:IS1595 family transposase [Pseudodesulfovibrio indicus]|uniref:Transposase n=1 Tax=Pseudodesulfovibrio indicus TaxID=1716143 RepID=A0AA94PQK8_9BACT|nr:IS1595 family transposase [Pseudodesulfovibrio indicus]TDT89979.1 transposase [Pseudodesulfovibrio indicus]
MRIKRSRLSGRISGRLIEHFVAGTPARTACELVGVNRNTAISFYHRLRNIIAEQMPSMDMFSGEVEVDESYFGGYRRGIRGRGAAGKVAVFGILKRNGRVYAQILPDTKSKTLKEIIDSQVHPDSVVYTDGLSSYNVLDVSEFKHYRINHLKKYVDGHNLINGIENFWNQAKRHLRKYNGIPRKHFWLYLKECEFRFNYGSPKEQLSTLKEWIKRHNAA